MYVLDHINCVGCFLKLLKEIIVFVWFWQYELLDEMMDFGYPQYTEAKILSEFIKTDAYRMEVTQRPPMAVTNAVSWRSEGIRYKKNEVSYSLLISWYLHFLLSCAFRKSPFTFQVFLDVVESVNILVNSNGQIIRSDVVGALKMRTYLRCYVFSIIFHFSSPFRTS